ncbi:MAG: hypothetical protein LUQ57_03835, partial [Methylococcaceae bacterium]|nr:hypothetical protein [Methylococcaceae bacterium]
MNAQTFRCYRRKGWLPLISFLLFFCMLSGVIWINYRLTLELMHQRTESTLQEMLRSFDFERLARMRQRSLIDLQYDSQSHRFTAYVPVQFQGSKHALRSLDMGAVYHVYDLAFIDDETEKQLISNFAWVGSAILVAFMLSWFIWDFLAALRSTGTDLKKTDSQRP